MNPTKLTEPWIPFERVATAVSLEPMIVILGLSGIAWMIYKLFLRELSTDRHRNLRILFLNLVAHGAVFIGLFAVYAIAQHGIESGATSERLAGYFGLAALISGAIVFIKASRILLFEYLFLGHMKEGVPVLIVNLFTVLLWMSVVAWFATSIFNVKLAPLLATSAVFSLVLGLALQDTLGNLFAGVALQLDKPYEIGDWIEVMHGGQKWVGQVHEITWRATTMIGLADELLVIPNRVMSNAEVANFSATRKPVWRSQTFRIPHLVDISSVKETLRMAVSSARGVRQHPEAVVNIVESTESWLLFRTSYTIDDYGDQFRIATEVITAVTEGLKASGQGIAAQRIQILKDDPGSLSLSQSARA